VANIWKVRSIVSGESEGAWIKDRQDELKWPEENDDFILLQSLLTAPVSELRDLLNAISNSITCLFKLSLVLRNPTPVDKYAKAASIGTYDSHFDVDYVWHKYPYLRRTDSSNEWLIERLGKANTRRREYFKYCEMHRKRLAFVPAVLKRDRVREEYSEQQSVSSPHMDDPPRTAYTSDMSPSIQATTTASTYVERIKDEEDYERQSTTSFATSLGHEKEGKLKMPPQPQGSENAQPFECKLCYTIQIVKGQSAWR
jgi:hypothetical protein